MQGGYPYIRLMLIWGQKDYNRETPKPLSPSTERPPALRANTWKTYLALPAHGAEGKSTGPIWEFSV